MKAAVAAVAAVLLIASALVAFAGSPAAEPAAREMPLPNDHPSGGTVASVPVAGEWSRPDGPVRVALQAGHWKASDAPDEQAGLRDNGTRGGGKAEWEVNLEIARRTAAMLQDLGYTVDILPTTIPPGYWADLFISIHADGHSSPSISGYRAAAPRRDATGRAAGFAEILNRAYGEETGLDYYGTVTRRMRGYYAFNNRRYEHALHPMTVGVILETGFLSSPRDRRIIVEGPDRAARGIVRAISEFLSPIPPVTQPTVARSLSLQPQQSPLPVDGNQAR